LLLDAMELAPQHLLVEARLISLSPHEIALSLEVLLVTLELQLLSL